MRVWTPEEAAQFLKAAESHRLYALFALALTTGMRQSELLGLEWRDVDLDEGAVRVVQQRTRAGVAAPKSRRGVCTVSIGAATAAILRDHRSRQAAEAELLGGDPPSLVFTTSRATPLGHRNVNRTLASLIRRAGVPHIRFHDLRHTHATHLLARGVHPKVVSERLGHATVAFTLEVYSHVLPSLQREAAALTDSDLFGDHSWGPNRAGDTG